MTRRYSGPVARAGEVAAEALQAAADRVDVGVAEGGDGQPARSMILVPGRAWARACPVLVRAVIRVPSATIASQPSPARPATTAVR